ncbi:hypothetical protein [Flavobacterium tructae]|uniref:Cell wall anchor protein n=1 Tax=Flavobacterium tructae TaxID=1114873 RepID=A0A1S1J2Q1_9FLAO|nr:hypothetical protein [Flavobacterium tructae]OHT43466.1 hypothetical protein BHE19_16905 [Flavobacterium tructae]OXB17255.1 hypothetical protein B0A71_16655 [Flavobacterium tructae]
MKKILLLASLFVLQINFAQNTYPTSGSAYYDTSLKIGKQEASAGTIGQINRLSLQPYGHTGGPWNFKARDNEYVAFLDIDYGITGSALTITSDKNIGIGTTNPSQKLEVLGNGFFKGVIISSVSDVIGGQIQLKNSSKTANGTASSWNIYNMTGPYGNSLQFWAYDNLACVEGGMCSNRFTIMDNGNVGIGAGNPTNKLDVNGTIHSKEVKIDMTGWSDFVFKKDYNLPTLKEVEKHIAEKGHLENIPSEEEVLKNGINVGEMNAKLLQKIEEMTLYMIEQNKKINTQSEEIESLKSLVLRVNKIESDLRQK